MSYLNDPSIRRWGATPRPSTSSGEWCEECGGDHEYVDCPYGEGDDTEPSYEEEVNSGPCMGEGCVNPHPLHTYAECETVKMHEDMANEQRIEELRGREWDEPLLTAHEIERELTEFRRCTVRLNEEQRAAGAHVFLRTIQAYLEGLGEREELRRALNDG